MTNQQYKNITEWTLKNMDAAERNDSLTVARAILNNCGVSLPEGGMQEILDALQSGDYMWWRPCTYEQAKSFADEGQPVVGVDDGRLIVIVPSGIMSDNMSDAMSGESSAAGGIGSAAVISGTAANAVTAQDASSIGSSFVLSAEALTAEQRSVMQFYASGCSSSTSTTTQQPEKKLTLCGIPERHVTIKNSGFEIIACMDNDLLYTVDAEWITDSGEICVWKEFKYHTHIAHIIPLQNGPMTITAIYENQRCSFDITVYDMHLYLSPANHHKEYTKLDGTLYPISEVSERKNMENIAAHLKSFLNDYWVDVMVTNIHAANGQYNGRPDEANQWIVDKSKAIYLALHSNAKALPSDPTASGSVGFHNGLREAEDLALKMVNAVDPLLGTESNRSYQTLEYTVLDELEETCDLSITAIILEMGFHDNPQEAHALITKEQEFAHAIGESLVDYYGLIKK